MSAHVSSYISIDHHQEHRKSLWPVSCSLEALVLLAVNLSAMLAVGMGIVV